MCYICFPAIKVCNPIRLLLACEQGEGKRKEGNCGNVRDLDFQIRAGNLCHVQINYLRGKHDNKNFFLNKLHSCKVGLIQLFPKSENLSIHQIFN